MVITVCLTDLQQNIERKNQHFANFYSRLNMKLCTNTEHLSEQNGVCIMHAYVSQLMHSSCVCLFAAFKLIHRNMASSILVDVTKLVPSSQTSRILTYPFNC